jgi:hypothetical protein
MITLLLTLSTQSPPKHPLPLSLTLPTKDGHPFLLHSQHRLIPSLLHDCLNPACPQPSPLDGYFKLTTSDATSLVSIWVQGKDLWGDAVVRIEEGDVLLGAGVVKEVSVGDGWVGGRGVMGEFGFWEVSGRVTVNRAAIDVYTGELESRGHPTKIWPLGSTLRLLHQEDPLFQLKAS